MVLCVIAFIEFKNYYRVLSTKRFKRLEAFTGCTAGFYCQETSSKKKLSFYKKYLLKKVSFNSLFKNSFFF